jgi:tRNA-dihydrouridine synthase B
MLLEQLQKNPFVLAPMAGITDAAFRSYMKEMGASIVITELISANGIEFGNERTMNLMRYEEIQRPVGIQLFGEEPEIVGRAARKCQELGADFVDLNFGCPVPKVVKKGAGSAILKDLEALKVMLSTVKKAIDIPLTIKIRTGWTLATRNAIEVCNIAYNEGITWVAIHGRDRAQGYAGLADWDYIKEVKQNTKVPVIGNGDILTANKANQRLKESGVDGVMIGRGCLKNPWIFMESLAKFQGSEAVLERDFMLALTRLQHYLEKHFDDRLTQLQMKKFAAWFSAGYPGSANFRRSLFQTKTLQDTLHEVQSFYTSMQGIIQADTTGDGFLMGGHG